MTLPELPPLPLEWEEAKSPSGRMTIHRLFSGNVHLASVTQDNGHLEVAIRHLDDPMLRYIDKWFRSLNKAKAAAEQAAQAEWKRFVAQLYTPKPTT